MGVHARMGMEVSEAGLQERKDLKCAKAAEGVRTGRATILYGLSLFQVSS